uniref:Putative transmembrane protein n=1 Tax=Pisum sativum TaxID=3888 RepID=P93478_PEA|nr:putative transmembrane protein [Pisum sativum]
MPKLILIRSPHSLPRASNLEYEQFTTSTSTSHEESSMTNEPAPKHNTRLKSSPKVCANARKSGEKKLTEFDVLMWLFNWCICRSSIATPCCMIRMRFAASSNGGEGLC